MSSSGNILPLAPVSARDENATRCPGCGAEVTDRFCSNCGERRPDTRHYSLHDLLEEAIENVAHFDGTLLRTVRAAFTAPGALTAAYMHGDRVRFTRPVQLFLVANLAFFFLSGLLHVHAFDTPLALHLHAMPYQQLATRMVERRLAARGMTLAAYTEKFDATATTQARSLVIVMVPFFALIVALINRGRTRYMLQHGVFALHFYVVFFAIFLGITSLAAVLSAVLGRAAVQAAGPVFSLAVVVGMTAYLARAEQRAYGTGRAGGLVRGAVLALSAFFGLGLYRGVLFFTTFALT